MSTAGFKTFTNLTQSNNSFIQPFNQQQQLVGGQMQQSTFLQSQSQNHISNQQTNWIPNTPINPFAQQQHGQSNTWVQNNQHNVQRDEIVVFVHEFTFEKNQLTESFSSQ